MSIKLFFPDAQQIREQDDNQLKSEQSKDDKVDLEQKLQLLDRIDKSEETSILLDQYKLVANSYESIQQRRISNNNVFVFVYSAIIGLYNFLSNENVPIADLQLSYSIYMVFLLGMIVGAMWVDMNLNIINSEKNKYRLLQMFESHMPLRIFSRRAGKKGSEEKIVGSRYLDLILPIFMTLTLALNFFLMMYG
jgi:hypothetical protein